MERRARFDWTDLASFALIIAFTVFCLYGAFGPWQWGHNGFNGAAFAQGARNAMRFGTPGQSLYYTGLTPPGPDLVYTHHPQLLHWHLIALFRASGQAPWIGRMIPVFYSVATLVLVHRIGAQLWDRRFALVATALWAFVPLHTIFANMIDHEQGAIFWLLLTTYIYVRWLSDHSPRRLVAMLVTISIAAQFDWPAYYIAFLIAVHAFVRGLGGGRPITRWRPEWTFVVLFSLVVLANFGGFFLWVRMVRGTLSEMGHAYSLRTGETSGYLRQLTSRALDMHGPLLLALTAAWLPLVGFRRRHGTAHDREVIPAFFLGAQIIHSSVFKTAGYIHSYWTYYLGAATAFGGAEVVLFVIDKALAWARDRRALRLFVLTAIVAFGAVHLGARAYYRLRWGFATGTGTYLIPYPDQNPQIRVAQWLGRNFPRESTMYVVHPSLPVRIEFHWYHDTPFEERSNLEPTAADFASGKRVVALVDTAKSGARATLARLVRMHPAWIFDRRFVAVEITGKTPHVEAFRSVARPQNGLQRLVHRWFVDPLHPPLEWEPDDAEAAKAAIDYPDLPFEGELSNRSGTRVEWDCPKGHVVVGIEGAQTDEKNPTLGRVRFACAAPSGADLAFTPGWGGRSSKPNEATSCPDGQVAIGIEARFGRFVDAVGLICARVEGQRVIVDSTTTTNLIGGPGGSPRRIVCPGQQVVHGVRVRYGALVDSLGIACGKL